MKVLWSWRMCGLEQLGGLIISIYLIPTTLSQSRIPLLKDYETRKLYPEFMSIPPLTMNINPCSNKILKMMEQIRCKLCLFYSIKLENVCVFQLMDAFWKEAQETFKMGRRFIFKITSEWKGDLFEASFKPAPIVEHMPPNITDWLQPDPVPQLLHKPASRLYW